MVHDVGLIHHVPLAERDEFLELIREKFPSDVQSSFGLAEGRCPDGRGMATS